MLLLFFCVGLFASVIGAICGVGGGVIIKPVLDLLGGGSVATVSFLSSCTVLSMSAYSVVRSFFAREQRVDVKIGTPLAFGAVTGGVLGSQLFSFLGRVLENTEAVGAVQAGCLALVTLGTALYTIFKARIRGYRFTHPLVLILIGLALGTVSSLLGIGGGPINLVVLFFFLSMDTKTAASYSLYIILFSQLANLLTALLGRSVPPFEWPLLICLVIGGIGGGIVGRAINKRIEAKAVDKLFLGLMAVIIGISVYNVWRFAS